MERREVKSRDTNIAKALAKWCAQVGITPNQLSIASIFFSLLAGVSYFLVPIYPGCQVSLYVLAILFICLRIACNLFDGMVAIEYNQQSPLGEIYNDVPDRFSDLLFLVGAGFSVQNCPYAVHLGWLAGSMAITTAYIRVLGKSQGTKTYYSGVMAKPQRWFFIVLATLLQIGFSYTSIEISFMFYALIIVAVGSLYTCIHRLKLISKEIMTR